MSHMDLRDYQSQQITLADGIVYHIARPVSEGHHLFWGHRNATCVLLTMTEAPLDEIVYYDVFFGEMYWQLTYYDEEKCLAVYGKYQFKEEREQATIDRGETRVLLRNIGYRGIIAVLVDRERALLNSPPSSFPVTTVSTNYDWVYDAHFPGSEATVPYGHHVFAIFAREGLRFQPVIRTGIIMDTYFLNKDIKEFYTQDPVHYSDALLLSCASEFQILVNNGANDRQRGLELLDRSEDEQREWENRVLEEARIALGLPLHPDDLSGIALSPLYSLLLQHRAGSSIAEGMLFHLRSPHAHHVWLTGEFSAWSEDEKGGAIALHRVNDTDLAVVIPASQLPPRARPYAFKFIVERQGRRTWTNGLYLVDPHDPFKNSLMTIMGQEMLYSKARAAARLQALSRQR